MLCILCLISYYFVSFVAGEAMVDRSKSVIRNGYFELSNHEKPKSTLSFATKSVLNISDKDLVQKGKGILLLLLYLIMCL